MQLTLAIVSRPRGNVRVQDLSSKQVTRPGTQNLDSSNSQPIRGRQGPGSDQSEAWVLDNQARAASLAFRCWDSSERCCELLWAAVELFRVPTSTAQPLRWPLHCITSQLRNTRDKIFSLMGFKFTLILCIVSLLDVFKWFIVHSCPS